MRVTDLLWRERFVAKLAVKHGVSTAEAEEALRSEPLIRKIARGRIRGEHVYAALSQIRSGRYLVVFFIRKPHGIMMPISARNMDASERRYYERER